MAHEAARQDSAGHEDSHRLRHPVAKLVPGLLDHLACKVDKRGGRFEGRSAKELRPKQGAPAGVSLVYV